MTPDTLLDDHKAHCAVPDAVKAMSTCLAWVIASSRVGARRIETTGVQLVYVPGSEARFENRVKGSVYPASEMTVEHTCVRFDVAGADALSARISYRTGRHAVVMYALGTMLA